MVPTEIRKQFNKPYNLRMDQTLFILNWTIVDFLPRLEITSSHALIFKQDLSIFMERKLNFDLKHLERYLLMTFRCFSKVKLTDIVFLEWLKAVTLHMFPPGQTMDWWPVLMIRGHIQGHVKVTLSFLMESKSRTRIN